MTGRLWGVLLFAAVLFVTSATAFRQCESGAPVLDAPEAVVLGKGGGRVAFRASDDGTGLRSLRAVLVHAEGEATLFEYRFPAGAMALSGPAESEPFEVEIDPETHALVEGSAQLRLEASDRSWRSGFGGNLGTRSIPIQIDLTPPTLTLARGIHYLQRGGSGAVRYRVADLGDGGRDGVEVGKHFFPGAPVDGGDPEDRIALFGIHVDSPDDVGVRVIAEDAAGNRRERDATVRVKTRTFPASPIRLPDSFLSGKVPELAQTLGLPEGDPIATFKVINERVREENETRIRELTAKSVPELLFGEAFVQMASSQVTSRFAERRTYLAGGSEVSKATHFGYDLASFSQAPIHAANRGRVVFAGELGIYGNCVLMDHGMGLASLYGHLSQIEVAAGELVERGGLLGFSGATGLAGGDHLHFALMIHGVYVDPIEWWDPKWVTEHLNAQLVVEARESSR